MDHLHATKIAAADLLKMAPEAFYSLRRELLQNISEADPRTPRLTCAVCGVGLHLALHGSGNRYFVHDSEPPACPWYTGGVVTRELKYAEEFLSDKESEEHYRLKWLIADALKRDPEVVGPVSVQDTLWGELLSGRWRRPDVQCTWRGRRIAFEIQLGTTHLREVVVRENFYRSEGIFVIWVFHPMAMDKAAHSDERFFNRRNVFFVDVDESHEGEAADRLKLLCRYDNPIVAEDGRILIKTEEVIVGLDDLTYPEDHYRPFYFDYPAKLFDAEEVSARVKESIRATAEREAAAHRVADQRRRNAIAAAEQRKKPTQVTKLAAASDVDLEAKALDAFRKALDRYQEQMDSLEERLHRFRSILHLFANPKLLDAASAALHFPSFQLLLIVRGLEIACPFPSSEPSLAQWCNDRLAELHKDGVSLVESLIGYAAWSAFPPSQPRQIQDRYHATLTGIAKTVAAGAGLNFQDKALLDFVGKLFPRVGEVIQSKLGKR